MPSQIRRIYIVDDDASVRRSVRFALSTAGYESHPFVSGQDFLDKLPDLPPGCVLLDIRMPAMSGMEVLSEIRRRGSRLPVVIMTGHGDVRTAVEAMKLGADDFLEKPFAKDEMLNSLEVSLKRLNGWSKKDDFLATAHKNIASLNGRELEVLRGLMAGYSNKEIAQKISLSTRTVEAYRANLMQKLNLFTVAELVRLGLAVKLTPLD